MGSARVLIAAGGSGGHIFPALALARTLKEKLPDVEVKFVGSNKALDRRIFEKEGMPYSLLSANKLPYGISFGLVGFSLRLLFDIVKAFSITVSFRPRAVAGFGGYVSGPVILAAWMFRIPCLVHEQNVVPGRANAFLFRLAGKVAISFEETRKFMGGSASKAVFTGNPIRSSILKSDTSESIRRMGLDPANFTILVIGGSQGAHFLNETFMGAIRILGSDVKSRMQVIHITGPKDYEWARQEYARLGVTSRVWSFIDSIEEAYAASDLVITRSGSSAIFELALFGKAMILVPYPFAMSHQAENARVFSSKGAAIEMRERDLSPEVFAREITGLIGDRARLSAMGRAAKGLSVPRSSENLADELLAFAGEGSDV